MQDQLDQLDTGLHKVLLFDMHLLKFMIKQSLRITARRSSNKGTIKVRSQLKYFKTFLMSGQW